MHLVRMAYLSKAPKDLNGEILNAILSLAQTNNPRFDITGLMVFNQNHFLQIVEGGRTAVSCLLGNLLKDTRHSEMVVMGFDSIDRREFGDWAMRFVPAAAIAKKTLLRYGTHGVFNPADMTYASALGFLSEMRETIPSE